MTTLEPASPPVLGFWDGHDCGAALLVDGKIIAAVNEERLSRRKLDVGFPLRSIKWVLEDAGVPPADIRLAACSTSDFAKTLTRCFPELAQEYYLLRRRKKDPGLLGPLKKNLKYRLTEWGPTAATRSISCRVLRRALHRANLDRAELALVDHHLAHAVAAASASGFSDGLVFTLDGIGDGLSGSIRRITGDRLDLLSQQSGKVSFGIFFEHVTNLLNMRELEDEGKVMALAAFSLPVPDSENPLFDLIRLDDLQLRSPYSSLELHHRLHRILWGFPSEQFAFMAQRVLEVRVCELVGRALRTFKEKKAVLSGGVFSNIKVNLLLRELPEVQSCAVFPHMGDGGLAAGAALAAGAGGRLVPCALPHIFLGPEASDLRVEEELASRRWSTLRFCRLDHPGRAAAELILNGGIVLWVQGRMEFGPRALGGRSILARPDQASIKDRLNIVLKRRVWYQPFCPSMLESDAQRFLEGGADFHNRFMTMAYRVRPEHRTALAGVTAFDGTCRPHIVPDDASGPFPELLRALRSTSGSSAVLNTSFNVHGEPIVAQVEDALKSFLRMEAQHLIIGSYLVEKRGG